MIDKITLKKLYYDDFLSMSEIAHALNCSQNKVAYWMNKHNIIRRSRSAANYKLYNKKGDPFNLIELNTPYLNQLYGMGLGLYWGEGTKASSHSVRLGNTDVKLINKFLEFLIVIYSIDESKLRFGLQLFNDITPDEALQYWSKAIGYPLACFQKPIVSNVRKKGNYRKKSKYGVLTIYFHNKKLRDILVDALPKNGVKYI